LRWEAVGGRNWRRFVWCWGGTVTFHWSLGVRILQDIKSRTLEFGWEENFPSHIWNEKSRAKNLPAATSSQGVPYNLEQLFLDARLLRYHFIESQQKVPLNWYRQSYSQRGDERRNWEWSRTKKNDMKLPGRSAAVKNGGRLQKDFNERLHDAQKQQTSDIEISEEREMNDRRKNGLDCIGMCAMCASCSSISHLQFW
jgi:hypothetical protein